MLPALFEIHDVDGDLSDHNVGKMFGLSKVLTVHCDIVLNLDLIGISPCLLLYFVLNFHT